MSATETTISGLTAAVGGDVVDGIKIPFDKADGSDTLYMLLSQLRTQILNSPIALSAKLSSSLATGPMQEFGNITNGQGYNLAFGVENGNGMQLSRAGANNTTAHVMTVTRDDSNGTKLALYDAAGTTAALSFQAGAIIGGHYFSISCPNNTATTLIDLATFLGVGDSALLEFGGGGATVGRGLAVVTRDRAGTGYGVTILNQAVAAYLALTMSGSNLQCTHTIGSLQNIEGSFVRLSQ